MKRPVHLITALVQSLIELMSASPVYRRTAIFSALLVLGMGALPLWRIMPLASERSFIPLHYNIYLGVDSFGPWYAIFTLPALGASLLVVNLVFEAIFFRREQVLSYFFAFATVFAEIVLCVAMVLIVLLNV